MPALAGSLGETIVGSCINCTTHASLLATVVLALVGLGLAARFEPPKARLEPREG